MIVGPNQPHKPIGLTNDNMTRLLVESKA